MVRVLPGGLKKYSNGNTTEIMGFAVVVFFYAVYRVKGIMQFPQLID